MDNLIRNQNRLLPFVGVVLVLLGVLILFVTLSQRSRTQLVREIALATLQADQVAELSTASAIEIQARQTQEVAKFEANQQTSEVLTATSQSAVILESPIPSLTATSAPTASPTNTPLPTDSATRTRPISTAISRTATPSPTATRNNQDQVTSTLPPPTAQQPTATNPLPS